MPGGHRLPPALLRRRAQRQQRPRRVLRRPVRHLQDHPHQQRRAQGVCHQRRAPGRDPAQQLDRSQRPLCVAALQVPQPVHQGRPGPGGDRLVPRRLHEAERKRRPGPDLERAGAPRAVPQQADDALEDPDGAADPGAELQRADPGDGGLDQRGGVDPHLDAGVEEEASEVGDAVGVGGDGGALGLGELRKAEGDHAATA
ncbi:RING-type domain-containing protein [Psidium guajava]|nr:RING-type domain-containing protein [Psidium guajava]